MPTGGSPSATIAQRRPSDLQPVPFDVSSESRSDGVHVVVVRGELDLNTAPQLESELKRALGNAGISR